MLQYLSNFFFMFNLFFAYVDENIIKIHNAKDIQLLY